MHAFFHFFNLFRAHSRNSLYIYVVLESCITKYIVCFFFFTEQLKKEWEKEYYLFIDYYYYFFIFFTVVNKEVRIHKKKQKIQLCSFRTDDHNCVL